MTAGTYTLLLSLEEPARIEVGALGDRQFAPGWYAYTGSAFGPGGFERVERHRRVAREGVADPHWHVDYLLPAATVEGAFTRVGVAQECAIARALPGERVAGFGASDCDCPSHLAHAGTQRALRAPLQRLYEQPAAT